MTCKQWLRKRSPACGWKRKHAEAKRRSLRMGNAWCPNRTNRVFWKFMFTPCNIESNTVSPINPKSCSIYNIYVFLVFKPLNKKCIYHLGFLVWTRLGGMIFEENRNHKCISIVEEKSRYSCWWVSHQKYLPNLSLWGDHVFPRGWNFKSSNMSAARQVSRKWVAKICLQGLFFSTWAQKTGGENGCLATCQCLKQVDEKWKINTLRKCLPSTCSGTMMAWSKRNFMENLSAIADSSINSASLKHSMPAKRLWILHWTFPEMTRKIFYFKALIWV